MKKVLILSLSLLFLQPSFSLAEEGRYRDEYSKNAIISDLNTGRIIYAKNADEKAAMASMSKIMTLLLTFDAIKDKKVSPNDIVTIQKEDVNRLGTNIKLTVGEKISLEELMKGMMLVSANDAALAISRYVAGDYDTFVKMMNSKAKKIGMTDTTFYNPNGLPYKISSDGVSTENTTTAQDVLKLSKWIYKHYPSQTIAITSEKRYIDLKKGINEESTNPLLPLLANVDGLKTGFTDKAGYCLSYSMKIPKGNGNDAANRLIGVSMGCASKEARKEASYSALTFIENKYKTKYAFKKNETVLTSLINNNEKLATDLVSHKNIEVFERVDEKFIIKTDFHKISLGDMYSKPAATVTLWDKNQNEIRKFPVFIDKSNLTTGKKIRFFFSALKASIMNLNSNNEYTVLKL